MYFFKPFLISFFYLTILLIVIFLNSTLYSQTINYRYSVYKGNPLHNSFSEYNTTTGNSFLKDSIDFKYKPWESRSHFWIAVAELAVVEFIPWAMAKWGTKWDNPEENWANVSIESWWNNIKSGWGYDGDAFLTNYFAHPYHGNLYYNVGRTNGFDFWESCAWSFSGSLLWEHFGEVTQPSINDWINTSLNGINLGEMLYRLSCMVTDNTKTGSERFWSEIGGTLLSPVRGFNRLITGETSKIFPNPEESSPKKLVVTADAGIRKLDKDGNVNTKESVEDGLFSFELIYGNIFIGRIKKPFTAFDVAMSLSSNSPNLTSLQSFGRLYGWNLKRKTGNHQLFILTLNYNYTNNPGFVYGGTSVVPQYTARFGIAKKTRLIFNIGLDLIAMGATPNDYYIDPEGRNYDFGPGVGVNFTFAFTINRRNIFRITHTSKLLWTQSEPAESMHQLHFLWCEIEIPVRSYFAVGLGLGAYWRNSYYENFEDIKNRNSMARIYFKTVLD